MKKIILLLLAVTLVFLLISCGTANDTKESSDDIDNAEVTEVEQPDTDEKEVFKADFDPGQENYLGNTAANLIWDCSVAKQGDWVYFFDGKRGIIKSNEVTGETVPVAKITGFQISVQGDYVYFMQDKGDELVDHGKRSNVGELWRIRTDGEELETIADKVFIHNKVGNIRYANSYYGIAGNKIYLRKQIRESNGDAKFCICRMNTDGTEVEQINDGNALLGVTESHVFFYTGTICCIPIDSDGTEIIEFKYKNKNIYFEDPFSIEGDTLYYFPRSEKKLYQVKAQSPQDYTFIYDFGASVDRKREGLAFNVYKGLVFACYEGLRTIDIASGEEKKLNEGNYTGIKVFDDKWIYFRDLEGFNRISQDGDGYQFFSR